MAADDDYDDEVHIPEPPYEWDPLEWEDLRASRRFAAFMKLALRAAKRVRWTPAEHHNEADWLYELAQAHPDLWERHEDAIWRTISWLRQGAPTPKPARLVEPAIGDRAEAIAIQRAKRGLS